MSPKGNHDDSKDDDDYVAQLLAQDAKNSSLKYSAVGMQAYMPKRPTTGAPKPNTRFLKNILRSTDSHNAALRKKEEEESKERRRQQRTGKPRDVRSDQEDHHEGRRAKRRKVEEHSGRREERERERRGNSRDPGEDNGHRKRHRRRHSSGEREATAQSTSHGDYKARERKERRRHKDEDASHDRASRKHGKDDELGRYSGRLSSRRRRSHSRSPSRSRSPERSKRRRRDKEEDERHRSGRRRHRRSDSRTRDGRLWKHAPESTSNNTTREPDKEGEIPSSPDSDPLSNLIGPLPPTANGDAAPIRSRGRGAYKASTMDSHFAENYDPTLDVQPDDDYDNNPGTLTKNTRRPVPGLSTEEDDWDMALEALRDRALWRRNGADRLREAGFGDDVVDKFTSNGAFSALTGGDGEKGIEDVKWAKKGEGREWDRGKVVDEDGHIDVKAAW